MSRDKKRKGFTLLELVVVIIVVSILSTLGLGQYGKMVEKSRGAEPRIILGNIRTAEEMYRLENNNYTGIMANLAIDAPAGCAGQSSHYFSYTVVSSAANTFTAIATRCTGATGRQPGYATANTLTLAANAVANTLIWSGDGLGPIW